MDKELNEDARTKQDLLYECNSLESRLSNEIVKNEHLDQQCKKQKEVIDKAIEFTNKNWGTWCTHHIEYMTELQNILKEGKNDSYVRFGR